MVYHSLSASSGKQKVLFGLSGLFGLNGLIAVCLACWSTWGIFDKKALDAAKYLDVIVFQHIIYVIEIPIVYLILTQLYPQGWTINAGVWGWTFLGSLASSIATLIYLIAMSKAEASFVLGITAAYPLVVQVLAQFVLNEELVPMRILGSILISAGVAFIGSTDHKHPDSGEDHTLVHKKSVVLMLCLVATLCWGTTGLFDKKSLLLDQAFKVYFARCAWDVLILAVFMATAFALKHKFNWTAKRAWKYSFLSSLCLSFGTIAYMFAMTMASASYVIVITGCYPLFMYFCAVFFLKEKIKKSRLIGVSLVVLGGLLVQQTQGS